jgi:hypothetical protein
VPPSAKGEHPQALKVLVLVLMLTLTLTLRLTAWLTVLNFLMRGDSAGGTWATARTRANC